MEKQIGCNIKVLHTDRDGEFLSNDFILFCEENGIFRGLTTPYSPQKMKSPSERIVLWFRCPEAYLMQGEFLLIFGKKQWLQFLSKKIHFESNSIRSMDMTETTSRSLECFWLYSLCFG